MNSTNIRFLEIIIILILSIMVLKWSLTTLLAPLIFAQTSAQALSNFSSQCLSFDPTSHVPNSTLNILSYVSSPSTLTFENPPPSCNTLSQNVSVPLCRIALNITTSSTSSVISEYWLPANWTGRFLTTGNGGIDGCIKYTDMEYGVSNGFAVAGSNNVSSEHVVMVSPFLALKGSNCFGSSCSLEITTLQASSLSLSLLLSNIVITSRDIMELEDKHSITTMKYLRITFIDRTFPFSSFPKRYTNQTHNIVSTP